MGGAALHRAPCWCSLGGTKAPPHQGILFLCGLTFNHKTFKSTAADTTKMHGSSGRLNSLTCGFLLGKRSLWQCRGYRAAWVLNSRRFIGLAVSAGARPNHNVRDCNCIAQSFIIRLMYLNSCSTCAFHASRFPLAIR